LTTTRYLGELSGAALNLWEEESDLSRLRPLTDLARAQALGIQADLDFVPVIASREAPLWQKLMSARRAVSLIRPASTVISSGFGGVGRPSVFFRALREVAAARKRPLRLTWITVSAAGARGRAEGSLEELAQPGLIARYISGHVETVKAFFPLVDAGQMKIHTLPQGVMTLLIAAQAEGIPEIASTVGIGTFLDPAQPQRTATGSEESGLIARAVDKLLYRLPVLEVALISAASVDLQGNLYAQGMAGISEIADAARAVRHNNGIVIAAVGQVAGEVPASASVLVPGDVIDHVVVHPGAEQIAGVPVKKYWDIFTPHASADANAFRRAYAALKFVNTAAAITPVRGAMNQVLARAAASLLAQNIRQGDLVNIGVGLPEEVAGIFCAQGLADKVVFSVESGVLGGIPAPGLFFGSAIHPQSLESSRETFERYQRGLPAAVLGFLQVDAAGNVNVSRRGSHTSGVIGPGGFIDICEAAQTIIFVGSWMVRGKTVVENRQVKIMSHGQPKFVPVVDEVTFSAARALKAGKRVFYATDFGILRLGEGGLTLAAFFPGIDRQNDIERVLPIPLAGMTEAATISCEIVSGKKFCLSISD
jgi:propionate CoA-transferase